MNLRNDLITVNQAYSNESTVGSADPGKLVENYKNSINETLSEMGIEGVDIPDGSGVDDYRQMSVAAKFMKDRGASTYGLNNEQMKEIFQKVVDPNTEVTNIDDLMTEKAIESGKVQEADADKFTQERLDFSDRPSEEPFNSGKPFVPRNIEWNNFSSPVPLYAD